MKYSVLIILYTPYILCTKTLGEGGIALYFVLHHVLIMCGAFPVWDMHLDVGSIQYAHSLPPALLSIHFASQKVLNWLVAAS